MDTAKRRAPVWLWALFGLSLTAPFWKLGGPLIEVDDARYAEVPREMAAGGDWVVPRLNGLPYVEKPPLIYWLPALSYRLLGVTETSARLPWAVTALAGILATAWLGAFLFDLETALAAAIMLASTGFYFFLGRYLTPDIPLTVCLLASCCAIFKLAEGSGERGAAVLAWIFAGLSFLCKGLIGFVFPGIWVLATAFLYPRTRPGLKRLLDPVAVAAGAAVALPWLILVEHRRPGFLRFFFIEQQFERYLTAKYHRGQPWYFYPALLPLLALPWTGAAASGAARAAGEWRRDFKAPALLLWVLLVVAFFTPSRSKLVTYVLPVMPELALLAAWSWRAGFLRWAVWTSRLLGSVLISSAVAAPWMFAKIGNAPQQGVPVIASAAALHAAQGALAILGLSLLLDGFRWFFPAAALSGLAAGFLVFSGLGFEGSLFSAQEIGFAARRECRSRPVWSYKTYLHGLPFYMGRPVDRMIDWVEELHYAKRFPDDAGRFGSDADVLEAFKKRAPLCLVMKSREVSGLLARADREAAPRVDLFGPWALVRLGR
jgi:4-amino-4-deoxy-L-arabinose transferase-like glycosyltransferase